MIKIETGSYEFMKKEKIIGFAETNWIILIPRILLFAICWFLIAYLYSIKGTETIIALLELILFYCLISAVIIIIKISTTRLYFTNLRLIGKCGILSTKTLDAPLNKLNDIMIEQNFIGKIFNSATIIIHTSSSKYHYKYIKDAIRFKNELNQYISVNNTNNDNKIVENDKYEQLAKLKSLLDDEIITQKEFDIEKEKILNKE